MTTVAPDDITLPAFLDRRKLIGTYTLLSAYRNCPHQMMRRYIARDQPYVESPEMKWGNDVHTALERRVGARQPLPDGMRQWETFAAPFDGLIPAVEQKLAVTATGHPTGFWDADTWFRGKLDVVLLQGTTAYLADWKTGGSRYEDPFELETGAMLLHAKNPGLKKIVGNYVWLKDNRLGQLYDLSNTAATWREVARLMGEIEQRKQTGQFEKRKTGLCGWCSVNDCEHWTARK